MKKFIALLTAMLVVLLGLVLPGTAASATEDECIPSEAWTETIEHPAVTHEETVHHDAVTHVVHHEAVPAGPDLWWNWSPNHEQGPFDGPPAFPVDPRGTWQGPHENGGPDQGTYGTFNSSNGENGRASWFHREHGTPGVEAYDEIVIDQEAYDETVTIVDHEAWTETIEHPAVTCDDEPEVTEGDVVDIVETSSYDCDNDFSTLVTTTTTTHWTQVEGEDKVFDEPVVTKVTEKVDHKVVACPTPNNPTPEEPKPHGPKTTALPNAGMDESGINYTPFAALFLIASGLVLLVGRKRA